MSKNLTRKGLALGAIVALGSTLFAGAPAFAGAESAKVKLAPAAGTTYTTLIGASFDLANELDPTIKSSGLENKAPGKLTFLVSNPSAQNLTLDLKGTTNAEWSDEINFLSGDTADLTGNVIDGSYSADTVDDTNKKFVAIAAKPASQSTDTADVGAGLNTLRIESSTDSTDAFAITVQAFIDDNNNGEIDTFELTSPVRTVNFIKASAATVTTAVTASVIGTKVLTGTVVIGNDVNNASLEGQVSIGFFKNGSAFKLRKAANVSVDTVDVSWDTVDKILTNSQFSTITSVDGVDILTAGTYTAKAYFGLARTLLGVESSGVSASAGTVTSADFTDDLSVTKNGNVKIAVTGTPPNASVTSAVTVKTGYTGSVDFSSYVLSADTHDKADAVKIAGITVKVTLTAGTTFGTGHEVTAGGVKLTSTSGAVSFTTTTDATGKIAFTAASNKGTKGDSYKVKVQVLTSDIGYETGDESVVTFTDATISKLVITQEIGSGAVLQIAKGASLPLSFEIRDDFGAASAVAGTYRVNVATNGSSNAGNSPVAAGKASFNLIDETLASSGNYTITAKVQKLNSAGTLYEDLTSSVSDTVVVYVGVAATAGLTVPSNATTGVTLEGADFVNHDLRLDANSKSYAGFAFTGTAFTVSGVATTATGATAPGALVSVTAPGAQLVATNDSASTSVATLATETITVRANSSGAYSVDVRSHIAGDVAITVTSGSVTKTVTAKFAWPSAANKDSKLAISGPSSTKAGRSNSFVVTLTDKWGNVVKKTGGETIAIEQTGAGYLVSTPVIVGATTGKAILNLITQPADSGLANITVTFDVASPDADIVVSKDILVGISATVTAASKKANVTVKNASGLTVKVVSGSKSTTKTATSDSYKAPLALTAGKKTVKVYVNDILVSTKVVTVRR